MRNPRRNRHAGRLPPGGGFPQFPPTGRIDWLASRIEPAADHKAGVGEFWLVDARGPETRFTIHRWEPAGFTPDHTAAGLTHSALFGCGFTLTRSRNPQGRPVYDLASHPDEQPRA